MLILSRRIGEQIQIGEHICVTVVRIGSGGVRIGVDAPEGYSVSRSEIMAGVENFGVEPTAEERAAAAIKPAGSRLPD